MIIDAMAKINLGLDVLKKREDGYHEIRTVMQTVGIYDTLELKPGAGKGIRLATDCKELPRGEANLVYRAARLIQEETGLDSGVEISLTKRIPMAAGMAGGSADAAAVLTGMNRLFALGLTGDRLKGLGLKLGADVPYCIQGGTVLCEGIGEKMTPLPMAPEAFLAVAKPGIDVSTQYVYENLQADRLACHPDIDAMINAIYRKDLAGIAKEMGNVLETVTLREYPVIEGLKKLMLEGGALNALMSGSGPSVFGIFLKKHKAEEALEGIRSRYPGSLRFLTAFAPGAQVIREE